MHRTYIDWAAAAPVHPAASRAFVAALLHFGNPSSPHEEGRRARAILEEARTAIARMAAVKTEGVVFTSGATEANALALVGHLKAQGRQKEDSRILYLPTAHASVHGTIAKLKRDGYRTEPLVLKEGAIDMVHLENTLKEGVTLITLDAVCGETGTRWDTLAVRRAIDKHAKGTTLHVDASQLPLIGAFTLSELGADMVTLDAQKVGGVRGIGALLMRHGIPLNPLMHGGGQERGLRPGTESAPLALAFSVALREAAEERAKFSENAERMRTRLKEKLSTIDQLVVNEGKEYAPHILNISLLGRDTDYTVALLDTEGFAVSTRSACETDAEGSRVVLALTGDKQRASSTLRISWGPGTKESDLDRFADALKRTVLFQDENAI